MSRVPFERLPDQARVWAFGTNRELSEREQATLLSAVDEFLDGWKAHGIPLSSARDWKHGRFLAVAVDQRDAHASGCSIDGLYRVLRALETQLGVAVLGGDRVYYRDEAGLIRSATREEFAAAAERGEVGRDSAVFDLTVGTLREWLSELEKPVRGSWHDQLLPAAQRG